MRRLLTAIAVFGFLCLPALATTRYTDDNGTVTTGTCTVTQTGTSACTITYALSIMVGCDTLVLADGTYDKQIMSGAIPSGSSSVCPTVIKAANQGQAILFPSSPTPDFAVINLTGNWSYIVFDGLYTDATNIRHNGGYYLYLSGSDYPTHITIKNCTVKAGRMDSDNYGVLWAVFTHHQSSSHTLQNCNIFNGTSYALYSTGGNDNLIEGNTFSAQDQAAMGATHYGVVIRDANNIFRNNIIKDSTGSWGAHGLILDGSFDSMGPGNNQIYNNIIYGSTDDGIWDRYGMNGNTYINNTIYNNGGTCIVIFNDSSNAIVRNNICWSNGTNQISDSGSSTTKDHNLCSSGCASSSDPQFVNAGAANFHLSVNDNAGSATGAPSADKDGLTRSNPPDRGAYEFVAAGATGFTVLAGSGVIR